MAKKTLIGLFFVSLFSIGIKEAISSSSGAPDSFTGSPSDGQTCILCHAGPPPTPISGLITSNIPGSGYVPGNTYTIVAQITQVGHNRFGFQISPQDNFGSVLGILTDVTTETQITGGGAYITHTTSGTAGVDSKMWLFDWTAPPMGTGSVTFYGAFNASDNNGSNNGDTIYTSTMTTSENIISSFISATKNENFLVVSPNPSTELIKFTLLSKNETELRIVIYNLNGEKVIELNKDILPYSIVSEKIVLSENISSGLYFLNVKTETRNFTTKFIILKN